MQKFTRRAPSPQPNPPKIANKRMQCLGVVCDLAMPYATGTAFRIHTCYNMLLALISLLPYRNVFRVRLVSLCFPAMRTTYIAVLWNITTGMLLHKPLLSREHRSCRNVVAAYHRQNKGHIACPDGSWASPLDTLACWNLP